MSRRRGGKRKADDLFADVELLSEDDEEDDFLEGLLQGSDEEDEDDDYEEDDDDDDDDDDEDEEFEFVPMYDDAGFLVDDEEDRAMLMAMPELKREGILADRLNEQETEMQRLKRIGKDPAAKRKKTKKPKKKKPAKKKRAKKARRSRLDDDDDDGDDMEVEDEEEYYSDDGMMYGDDGRPLLEGRKRPGRRRRRTVAEKAETRTPIDVKTIRLVQMRRVGLIKTHSEPYFESYVRNMFVRVPVRTRSGADAYMMCEVVDLKEVDAYEIEKNKTSRVGLELDNGSDKPRTFHIIQVSNHSIQQQELDEYVRRMEASGRDPITMEEALYRKKDADMIQRSFRYDKDTVDALIRKNKAANIQSQNLTIERQNLTRRKRELEYLLEHPEEAKAEYLVDDGDEEQSRKELESVNEKLNKIEDLLRKRDKRHNVQAARMAQIARRNREIEIRKTKELAKLHAQRRAQEAKADPDSAAKLNPFQRKMTRPALPWAGGSKKKKKKKKGAAENGDGDVKKERPTLDTGADMDLNGAWLLQSPTGTTPTHAQASAQELLRKDVAYKSLVDMHDFHISIDPNLAVPAGKSKHANSNKPMPRRTFTHAAPFHQEVPGEVITRAEYEKRIEEEDEGSDDDEYY